MLSIFSCASWPSVCLLCRNVCLGFLPIFWLKGPTVQHREFCSMLCGSLGGRGIWGRMDTCICTAGSLCCAPETITSSKSAIIQYEIKKKKFFLKKQFSEVMRLQMKLNGLEWLLKRSQRGRCSRQWDWPMWMPCKKASPTWRKQW